MKHNIYAFMVPCMLLCSPILTAQDDELGFDEDYYLGFSQGVYYGLMLAGTEYDIAWCVKAELAYEAEKLGSGGEFQTRLNAIHAACAGGE